MFIINTFSTCFGHHYAEPAQHTTCSNTRLVLLKMGIMMPETCWESIDNAHLTGASCWFSISLHNLLTMHCHRNLKKPKVNASLNPVRDAHSHTSYTHFIRNVYALTWSTAVTYPRLMKKTINEGSVTFWLWSSQWHSVFWFCNLSRAGYIEISI